MSSQRVSLKAKRTPGSARTGAHGVAMADRAKSRKKMRFTIPSAVIPRGPEIKGIDIPQTTYLFRGPATASNVILLNGIQTGTGLFNRIGDRIEMINLHIRGFIYNNATSTTSQGRMLIVYDRGPTGALPTIQTITASTDQTGATATTGVSEINLSQRGRFSIIRDMSYYFPPCTNTAGVLTNGPSYPSTEDQQFDVNEFIRLKNIGTMYSGTANPCTIANISVGALYAVFTSSGTDSAWGFNGGFRLRYGDA